MEKRKAQVTLFIILAIVIVAGILMFLLAKQNLFDLKNLTIPSEVRPIHSFIQSCVEQTTEDAINYIGDNGGYYISPNNSLFNGIPIYFDEGEINVPSKEQVESELSEYVNEMLFFCTKNFIDFEDFEISQSKIQTTTRIEKGKVTFDINYPISISKQEKTYNFNIFNSEYNVRLLNILNTSHEMIKYQSEFPEDICITCIEDLAMENKLLIEMRDFQDSVIFSIMDLDAEINEKEFAFYFANNLK